MKLYYSPMAPNPTKVRIYLGEKGLELEQVSVNLRKGEQRSSEHLARSPLAKVPALELDDGTCLTESLAIIELLEELHPDPPMIGVDPFERARVRSLERLADLGVLVVVGRIVHATRSPLGLPPVPEIAEAARRELPKALAILDTNLADRAFVAGDHPTIADCTLWAAINFARLRQVEIDPSSRNVERWFGDFSQRPSVGNL